MQFPSRSRFVLVRQPVLSLGLCTLGVLLLMGSAVVMRVGKAHAASVTDTTCTTVSYTADLAAALPNGMITFNCAAPADILVNASTGVAGALTINNIGQPVTLDGNHTTQVFTLLAGSLSINNIRIANGTAGSGGGIAVSVGTTLTVSNSTLSGNSALTGRGGAINDFRGTVTITNSTLSNNTAQDSGGGIEITGGGALTVSGTTFSGNSATLHGGGVDVDSFSPATINSSTFSNNSALTLGGAIFSGGAGGGLFINAGGSATVTDTSFTNNAVGGAGTGGGLADFGVVTVSGSTFSGNVSPGGQGGGLAVYGAATIDNSTFSGNSTVASSSTVGTGLGGGLLSGGTVEVVNSTISGNSSGFGGGVGFASPPGTVHVANAIVAGNPSGGDCAGSPVSDDGNNLTDAADASCGFSALKHDVLTASPGLGALGAYGGLTQTIDLLAGSPAIDAANDNVCAAFPVKGVDQRGISRPQGPHCDIGAYERAPFTTTHVTANPNPSVQGQKVEICATVAGVSGTSTPSGTITFKDGTATLGIGTLVKGGVCISTTSLSVGGHTIFANYSGDSHFDPSAGAVDHTVGVYGADVAGSSGGNAGVQASNGGATGNATVASGASASGQQSQNAASSGLGTIASTSGTQPSASGIWSAGLGLGLLLLLMGLGGLSTILVRAARSKQQTTP